MTQEELTQVLISTREILDSEILIDYILEQFPKNIRTYVFDYIKLSKQIIEIRSNIHIPKVTGHNHICSWMSKNEDQSF